MKILALYVVVIVFMTFSAKADEVSLETRGGTYAVPATINGVIKIKFLLDSGASDVSIPADTVSTLARSGTLAESDFIGDATYTLADGSTLKSKRFMLHEMQVGDQILRNVAASVAPVASTPLIGQSFLSRLGSWTIDNQRHVLVFGVPLGQAPTVGTVSSSHVPAQTTLWKHNGSVVYLMVNGTGREFYYHQPRPGMVEAGAKSGSLLFRGQFIDGNYRGTAFIFNSRCGQFPYEVAGPVDDDYRRVVMRGDAPRIGQDCRIVSHIAETLDFSLIGKVN
jgi:clan AA aspartic protease (TIGR02281 family)